MTMLCDSSIRKALNDGELFITPEPEDIAIQPASVDLRLDTHFRLLLPEGYHSMLASVLTLMPGSCALGTTQETIEVPDHLVGRVEGKSTWGRRFLQVHSTAGFIDPGFKGQVTLELRNNSPVPLLLEAGEYICQVSFELLDAPASRPYGHSGLASHYQGQIGATPPFTAR